MGKTSFSGLSEDIPDVRTVVWSILLMTDQIRSYRYAPLQGAAWWVLALGDSLTGKAFPERDEARERLRKKLLRLGISRNRQEWVWDEAERVQLVLLTYFDYDEACRAKDLLDIDDVPLRIALKPGDEE